MAPRSETNMQHPSGRHGTPPPFHATCSVRGFILLFLRPRPGRGAQIHPYRRSMSPPILCPECRSKCPSCVPCRCGRCLRKKTHLKRQRHRCRCTRHVQMHPTHRKGRRAGRKGGVRRRCERWPGPTQKTSGKKEDWKAGVRDVCAYAKEDKRMRELNAV